MEAELRRRKHGRSKRKPDTPWNTCTRAEEGYQISRWTIPHALPPTLTLTLTLSRPLSDIQAIIQWSIPLPFPYPYPYPSPLPLPILFSTITSYPVYPTMIISPSDSWYPVPLPDTQSTLRCTITLLGPLPGIQPYHHTMNPLHHHYYHKHTL